jgi:choline kinase
MKKLLILAAGVGSRMESYTNQINKGLLPIGGKAVISHVIENCDVDEIVLALGYKSEQVVDYCKTLHPDKKIKFVIVDNYDKPGSGPGYSMYCCRDELQCPFYIATADSYIYKKLPEINTNWIGISKVDDLENYSTCKVENGNLVDFKNKSKDSYEYAYTGIAAIKDYDKFWEKFENHKKIKVEKEVENVVVFYKPFFADIFAKEISWIDVGRKSLYEELNKKTKGMAHYELKKIDIDEFTYKVNNKVAKINLPEKIKLKKQRAEMLSNLIESSINSDCENLICHNFIEGKTLYEVDNIEVFEKFLLWLEKNLFNKTEPKYDNFKKNCLSFYKEKTFKRVKDYINKNLNYKNNIIIDNINVSNIYTILENINWEKISDMGICSIFHGDLNFGNVIYTKNNSFKLIDWRSDFEGALLGDSYYDLAKLYAGTNVNFSLANEESDPFSNEENKYILKVFQTKNNSKFLELYESWIIKNYDLSHVKTIAALSYLNMSPLHPEKFGQYLFLKGFLELFKVTHDTF